MIKIPDRIIMIFNFFKKKEKDAKKLDTYEEARSALEGQKTSDKLILAEQSTTPKEVLYYLAEDPSVEIRKKLLATTIPHYTRIKFFLRMKMKKLNMS